MSKVKVVRIPKEWVESCRHCNGVGKVLKREHFALWTPDEDNDVAPLDPKHDVPHDAYVCTAAAGATINEACREGVQIAGMVKRPVVFEFNGAVAICREGADPEVIMKRWWKMAYGRTYEQSMALR